MSHSRRTTFGEISLNQLVYSSSNSRLFFVFCFLFFVFFLHSICFLGFSILSLLVLTQIRGDIAGSCSPLPTTVRALHFYREKISGLSSLVDSRRIVLAHARRSQQLIHLFIYFYFCK